MRCLLDALERRLDEEGGVRLLPTVLGTTETSAVIERVGAPEVARATGRLQVSSVRRKEEASRGSLDVERDEGLDLELLLDDTVLVCVETGSQRAEGCLYI